MFIDEPKNDIHDMIKVHEMDIHFVKTTITLSGRDIYIQRGIPFHSS